MTHLPRNNITLMKSYKFVEIFIIFLELTNILTYKHVIFIGSRERISDRAKVDRYGQMDLCMKVGGKTTKLMARED